MIFLLALLSGAASAFAYQPYALWPLMVLAFAALCEFVSRASSMKRALLTGWLFGLGQFCIGLNWIATSFTYQAAMPAWLGWIAVFLLSLYLAVYPMMAAGLAWRFGQQNRLALVLALAGGWAITEWLRATMFTGFAWNPVGVALVDTPWRGVSQTVGTYGLSMLVVLAGAAIWLAWNQRWKAAGGIAAAVAMTLALPIFHVEDRGALRTFDAGTDPHISTIRVVQPNIGQEDKWREGFEAEASRRLATLSQRPPANRAAPPGITFWPEAAVTNPLSDQRIGAERFILAERMKAGRSLLTGNEILMTGGLGLTSADQQTVGGATNSVFVIDGSGRVLGRYDKAHLVPYGEYLPMRPILSAIGLSRLAPGDLDFAPGPGPITLNIPRVGKVGFQLCYEIIFSGEVVDPKDRPNFIFNPSNDAWFGRWGPPQHLAQARLRAVEEGIPVVRSTPTGISAVVDANGEIRASIPWRTAGIIDTYLPLPAPPTLFAKLGNPIPLLLGFALLIAAIALGRRSR